MARRIELSGSPPPVNDGERRVVSALVDRLPDDYVVWPAVQVVQRHQVDDIDVLVRTRDCLVAIEVKDLAGDVVVGEQEFNVDGESRSHPYLAIARKARRLKSRLVERDPSMHAVWVAGIVVLARRPRRLDVAPNLQDKVVDVERAIELLQETARLGSRGEPLGELAGRIEALIAGERQRRRRPVLGSYRVTEVLVEDDDQLLARAEHTLTGREVRLRRVKLSDWAVDPAERQRRRTQALREAEALQRLGHIPTIVGERESFETDDHSIVLIADPPLGPSLTEAMEQDLLDDEARWRVLSSVVDAVSAAHRAEIIHRRISPSLIEIPSNGASPRLGGFGFAKLRSKTAGASPTIGPEEWSGVIEPGFVPPELEERDGRDAGVATDYWSLGALARYLWPTELPEPLRECVPLLLSADPNVRTDGFDALRDAVRDRLRPSAPSRPPFVPQKGAHLGEYVLEAPLGSGASSSVWRAYEPLAGEARAIKILEQGSVEALQREYQALLRVDHEHVVEVKGAGTDGAAYLVFELLDGRTLRDALDASPGGRLELDDGIDVVRQLLQALVAIHPDVEAINALTDAESLDDAQAAELDRLRATGVVHRDVKPENLMLTSRGVVLFDFGLASSDSRAVPGGTAAYRPADASADSMDPDVDLFATGVILYEVLTGEHPYPNGQPTADPPRDPRTLNEEIPGPLTDVMVRACAPTRSGRYESASELLDDLDDAVWASGQESIQAESTDVPVVRGDRPDQSEAFPREGTLDSVLGHGREPPKGAPDDVLRIGSVSVVSAGSLTHVALVTPSGDQVEDATVERFVAHLDEGGSLELRCVRTGPDREHEAWVECSEARDVPPRLGRLEHGLNLRIYRDGDVAWAELRLARVTQGDWSSDFRATLAEIDAASGCEARAVLVAHGAMGVGTRAELLGHHGPRSSYVATTFSPDDLAVPLAAYVLTRILPLSRSVMTETAS